MNTNKPKGTRAFEFHRKQLINLQSKENEKNVVDTKLNYELREKLTSISIRHRSSEQKKFIDVLNSRYSSTLTKSKENKEMLKKIVNVQRVGSLFYNFII
jgi:transcription elongation GreA/GreB family factor